MSEYMGLIHGVYDAKEEGFMPGGGSLHNCMSAHGPDAETFKKASEVSLEPQKIDKTLAFMFESKSPWVLTKEAETASFRQKDYLNCWKDLPKNFKG
jgi:homogentisate 1,2-dioxygenase